MTMPTWREWLYSAKALIAALLALYIALAIPLDNPYWAMAAVYVVSHPLSGATRSKAIYRALGTLLGAAASVAMLPLFVHQPIMLSLVMALWVGVLLYLSLRDGSPRSYIFMLAAYTVPLITLTEVNTPQTIFDVALARTEEIVLGIVCASLVNALLFPSRIAPVLGAKMDVLLNDARVCASRMLNVQHLGEADQTALHRLLADVMGLDGMIVHLSYDSASHLPARHAREFRARMALLAPQLMSLADSLRGLQRERHELLAELEELLMQVDGWIQGHGGGQTAEYWRGRSYQLETWLSDTHPGQALLIGSSLGKLRELIDLWQDCLNLRQGFADGHPEQAPSLHYKVHHLVGGPRRYDHIQLAFSATSVGLSVLFGCLVWIASGWEHGYSGVFMMAVAGCFFAGQDNPAPFIKSFLTWTLVSCIAAGTYLFALMPNIHDFGSLATVLALPLLLLGTLTGRPQYTGTVVLLAVQTISSIAIQDSYQADFPLFADVALSTLLGVIFALIWARLSYPFGTLLAVRRMALSDWRSLAVLALAREEKVRDQVAWQLIDRTSQLLPRLAQQSETGQALAAATRDLRICFRLLELQQRLPAAIDKLVQLLLEAVHDYFQDCARAGRQLPVPDSLRYCLDDSLAALQLLTDETARATAQSLIGLHLVFFPDAAPLPPAVQAVLLSPPLNGPTGVPT